MSGRRKSRPSISLFEFLAVLVCVMGALILLLLVTTRHMRQQALAEAEAEMPKPPGTVIIAEPIPELPAPPPIELAVPESDAPLWSPPEAAWQPSVPIVPEPDPYSEAERANAALRREWESNIAGLESQWAALQQNWDEWQATLTAAELAIQNLQSRLQQLDGESSAIVDQEAALEIDEQRLMQSHAELQTEIDSTAALLEAIRTTPKPVASRFSILPYDSASGTTRRPIIIECTENQIAFASEGVILSAADIEGFTPAFNPLQAGADALEDYWRANDRQAGTGGDPYIMLVVRPGGTISYYIARKLLETVGDRYGYELVGADQEFVWPETTPEATRLCREAVESRIAERDRVIDGVGGGHLPVAGPLQFVDEHGNFFLEEVAELRDVHSGEAASSGGTPGSGGGRSNRRDLSSIFGEPAEDPPQQGQAPRSQSSAGQQQPSGSQPSQHLHQPQTPAEQSGTTAESSAGGDEAAGEMTEQHNGGATQGGRNSQGQSGGQQSPPGSQTQWPDGFEPTTPSWIEERREPDSSPSYQTHPGLFNSRAGTNPSAQSNSQGASQGPLVIETGSLNDGNVPAPVVSGSQESPTAQRRIGYRRDVYVYIDESSFQVAGMDAVAINSQMTREQVSELLANDLRSQISAWEPPPEGGDWAPRVRFEVRRGGNAYLRTMTQIVSEWQINWTANYTTE